jgi:membrane protein
MRRYWDLTKRTYNEWDRHHAPTLGASLAYYTVLSLAPLLIVVTTVVGLALGHAAAQGHLMEQIQGMVGGEGAKAIQQVIAHADQPKTGIIASLLGLVTLFLGASGVFAEIHDALNRIWDIKPKPNSGIWRMVRERFLSFGMLLVIGFLLLVSLVISAGIAAAGKYVGGVLPIPAEVLRIINALVSLAIITTLFAMIFRFLPDEKVGWSNVWTGAFATAVLFTIGKYLIGLYLGKASIGSAYGAAGSLVIVLVWVYYSAQIFFFGAEFTHVYAEDRKRNRVPLPEAPPPENWPALMERVPPQPKCEDTQHTLHG